MWQHIRNLGRPGICSMAISAVDCAVWDLKAKLLDLPLVTLLGQMRRGIPVYGSGGFTSYSEEQLASQLSGWVKQGIHAVKMKVGRNAQKDVQRVQIARDAIGPEPGLYVDANGAYNRKQALAQAEIFSRVSGDAGSRSRYRPTISQVCGCSATVRPPAWTSPPESMATTFFTSAGCLLPARWTCNRQTSRAAVV